MWQSSYIQGSGVFVNVLPPRFLGQGGCQRASRVGFKVSPEVFRLDSELVGIVLYASG